MEFMASSKPREDRRSFKIFSKNNQGCSLQPMSSQGVLTSSLFTLSFKQILLKILITMSTELEGQPGSIVLEQ